MKVNNHFCEGMPEYTEIRWSDKFAPYMCIDIDNDELNIGVNIDIDYCPWCGEDLQLERYEWLQSQHKPF